MGEPFHHEQLARILRLAYSGELGAALAYRGHWQSLPDSAERDKIQQIEDEEWDRRRVGVILTSLGSAPDKFREMKLRIIGRSIGAACHITGWFLPMYFAGRIESKNVKEYEEAAEHAAALGLVKFETELRARAEVEKQHELFFLQTVAGHSLLPLTRWAFKWGRADVEQAKNHEARNTSGASLGR
jgi:demethoxyubiquinone hydroxylase (CLK1/Coq7/Cat5 family)